MLAVPVRHHAANGPDSGIVTPSMAQIDAAIDVIDLARCRIKSLNEDSAFRPRIWQCAIPVDAAKVQARLTSTRVWIPETSDKCLDAHGAVEARRWLRRHGSRTFLVEALAR